MCIELLQDYLSASRAVCWSHLTPSFGNDQQMLRQSAGKWLSCNYEMWLWHRQSCEMLRLRI